MVSLLNPNIQAFMAVAREGTVHAAAASIGLTQTGVTQRLRALERQLGATLFTRSRRGMLLTSEGQALLRYGQGVEELAAQSLGQVREAGIKREVDLTVVGPTSAMTARMAPALLPLYKEWPHLNLHLMMDDRPDRLALLRNGAAQVAIVPPVQVPREMDSRILRPDRYLLVGTRAWKGRRLAEILKNERIVDFHAADTTSLDYLRRFDLLEHVGRPRLFVNDNQALISYFRAGIGPGTLTQEIARPLLDSGELIALNGGQAMEDPLALAWWPRGEMPPYFQAVLKAMK